MKKALYILIFFVTATYCHAQDNSIPMIQQRMIGVWQNNADTNNVLNIMSDYITLIDSGKVVITYNYTFSNESCSTTNILPAATGVYLVEIYNGKTICCALAEVGYKTLKIIYPGGNQVIYTIRADLPRIPKSK